MDWAGASFAGKPFKLPTLERKVMHSDTRGGSGFRRWLALICATAYLMGGAEALPQIFTLAA